MISVVMCTYNRERFLRRAIESVQNQTWTDWEFLIVDDGSTDGSLEVLHSFRDERIRIFSAGRNSFYCHTVKTALQECKGEYIAFINSDDAWYPTKLEEQMQIMETHREYGACFTNVTLVDDEGRDITAQCPQMAGVFSTIFHTQKDYLKHFLLHGNTLCHPSSLIRRDIFERSGGLQILFSQVADLDLWVRIVTMAPIYVIPRPLVWFRWDVKSQDQVSSSTTSHLIRTFNEECMIRKELIERLSDREFREYFQELFENPESATPLELAFERAFVLSKCMRDGCDLKLLGYWKIREVLEEEGAVDLLYTHFHKTIYDIYAWGKEHFYVDPWICQKLAEGEQKEAILRQCQKETEDFRKLAEDYKKHSDGYAEAYKKTEAERLIWKEHSRQLEERIRIYETSTIWKMTKPLRQFLDWLKRGK